MSLNVTIKKSRNGKGLFTNIAIPDRKTVLEIKGTRHHYLTLWDVGGTFLDNCFRISEMYYLSPGDTAPAFLNHSCKPNCKIVKQHGKLYLVAIENISKNSELFFDYSTVTARDDIWKLTCNCGQKSCRKLIEKYTKLPKQILKDYLARNIIPRYILDI